MHMLIAHTSHAVTKFWIQNKLNLLYFIPTCHSLSYVEVNDVRVYHYSDAEYVKTFRDIVDWKYVPFISYVNYISFILCRIINEEILVILVLHYEFKEFM